MSAVSDLLRILNLEATGQDVFLGQVPQVGWGRVFGGLVIAQALAAARRTVEGREAHSLHGYFLLGGDPALPISYEVERIRDGGSFSTRRVVARQRGQAIFFLSASFQGEEEGFTHHAPMPKVPEPESLPAIHDISKDMLDRLPHPVRAYFERDRPIDLRPVDYTRFLSGASEQLGFNIWIRATGQMPDDPGLHRDVLAYASDMTLLDASLVSHHTSVYEPAIQAASLDHSMWFHRNFRADDWLLYAQESPNAGGGRGFARGLIFTRKGELVASVAQEGVIRRKRTQPA